MEEISRYLNSSRNAMRLPAHSASVESLLFAKLAPAKREDWRFFRHSQQRIENM
jgi:hypothetical protein